MVLQRLQSFPQSALRVHPATDDPSDEQQQEGEENGVLDDDAGLLAGARECQLPTTPAATTITSA